MPPAIPTQIPSLASLEEQNVFIHLPIFKGPLKPRPFGRRELGDRHRKIEHPVEREVGDDGLDELRGECPSLEATLEPPTPQNGRRVHRIPLPNHLKRLDEC